MSQKKVMLTGHGGVDRLQLVESVIPEPGDAEALVRIEHAGVAFADIMMRHGKYPGQPRAPFTPGFDVVGVVESAGAGTSLAANTRVLALTRTGGYAQYIVVRAEEAVPVPDEVPPEKAVCLGLNYLTAYQILKRVCSLEPGASVLVHSAAGGVGTAALQLGRLMKLNMFGTASASKLETVRNLGAFPIDYRSQDFVDVVRKEVPQGLDAVLDPVGPTNWLRSRHTLKRGGCLVAFGGLAMHDPARDVIRGGMLPMVTAALRLKLFSSARLAFFDVTAGKPEDRKTDLGALLNHAKNGEIDPLVAGVLPLADIRKAHTLLGSGEVVGKLVLDCR